MSSRIPAVIIGASGYVGGELLRLIAGHPNFELAAAVSDSVAGKKDRRRIRPPCDSVSRGHVRCTQ